MTLAEKYRSESRRGWVDDFLVSLGRREDCQGLHTGSCSSGSRSGREVNSSKLRSYEELFSGVKFHIGGCFNGKELQAKPRFQASESGRTGEGDTNVFTFAGGANR